MAEYIEREAAIEAAQYAWVKDLGRGPTEYIESIPAADVEPVRHGRWIPMGGSNAKCSFCHTVRKTDLARDHYCPNCGAKMDRYRRQRE